MVRPDVLAAAAIASVAVLLAPARALPPPAAPAGAAHASPSPTPNAAAYLAAGSPLDFVMDDPVDSRKTKAGTLVRVHLAKPLAVGGVQVASAGTPGTAKVVSTRPAQAPDVDGAVELFLEPLALPGRGSLPLSLSKSYVTIEHTAGQESTRDVVDSAADILIPGHAIYHALRKGHELSLPVGTVIRARTAASIDASHPPNVVIATPQPFHLNTDVPYAAFTPIPVYVLPTPPPRGSPRPTRAPQPRPTATAIATTAP